jgi:hypothetical protein
VCARAGRNQEALAAYAEVLALDPGHFGARASRALLLGRRGDPAVALQQLEGLLAEAPAHPRILNGVGVQLQRLGRVEEALGPYHRALELDPAFAEPNSNLANAYLLLGNFGRGWHHHGNKWRGGELLHHQRSFSCPLWQGEPLAGRSLFVWAEQGLGDQIMFASMFADIAAQSEGSVFECSKRLAGLFKRSFAQGEIVPRNAKAARLAVGTSDFHAPMSALCEYLRGSWGAFPRHTGYLTADTGRRAAWRRKLADLGGGLKIGISWRGGTPTTGGADRSSVLEDWRPLLAVPGAKFISLQYGKCESEIAALRAEGYALEHWQEAVDDFEESAALVSELDLVVSVCTTVIHLAGALARPVWVLVPARPGWRYLLKGEQLPWYPSARMLRQPAVGDWRPLIERAAGELEARIRG